MLNFYFRLKVKGGKMSFDKKYGIFLILAVAILGTFFILSDPTGYSIQENSAHIEIPEVLDGQEIESKGYKYSNTKGVILSTPSYISCPWKAPENDDGWKICEVIFEVNNADKATEFLENPRIDLSFENTNNIKNVEVLYSNNFEIIEEVHKEYKTEIVQVEEPSKLKTKNSLITGQVVSEENENNNQFSRENKVKLVVREEQEIITKRNFENFFESSEVIVADRQGNIKESISEENLQKGFFGNLAGRVIDGFEKDPSSINTEKPFAVMVRFEIPKYNSNSFDFSLVDKRLQAFIDPEISVCGTLGEQDAVYTISQNISATGTCFNIEANNVTLDCQGNTITYATSGSGGYGVYSTRNNTIIRNCNFIEGNSGNSGGKAIYFSNTQLGKIYDNDFSSVGTSGFVVHLSSSENNSIYGNEIVVTGPYYEGIYADSSSDYLTVRNNTINFSSDWGGAGIYVGNSINAVVLRNTIYVNGNPGNSGIYFDFTTSSNASFNIVNNLGPSSYGFFLSNSLADTLGSNIINASGFSSDGVYAEEETTALRISNNEINSSGQGGVGIYFGESDEANINDNNIQSWGQGSYGILVTGSPDINIYGNQLDLYGVSAQGIILEEEPTPIIKNNTINIQGDLCYGISSYTSEELNLTRNIFTISSDNSTGIYLETTHESTFFHDLKLTLTGSDSSAIYVDSNDNYFNSYNAQIDSSASSYDFKVGQSISSGNWNFTNTSILSKDWASNSNGNLRVYWYLEAVVKYSNGTLIQGANVTGVNINGVHEFSELTNSQGEITTKTIIEYLQTGQTSTTFYSNYNISAAFGDFYSSELVNLTENKNLIFTFDPSSGESSSEESSDGTSTSSGIQETCNPKWKCSKWSNCEKGKKTRTCVNNNPSCNLEKPRTEIRCTPKNRIKKILFDIKLDPIRKRVVIGEDLFVVVSLFNLGVPGQVNVSLAYEITNSLGEIIYNKEEIILVETQIEFIKDFDASGFPLGEYYLSADLEYEEQTEPARAEVKFIVRKERNPLEVAGLLVALLVFIGIIIYFLAFWKPKKKHTFFYKDIKERLSQAKGKDLGERQKIHKNIMEDFKELNEKEKNELLPKIEKIIK